MLALVRCAVVPPPATPEEALARTPVSDSNAVVALAESARADTDGGNFIKAAAALERALRIEPRNPRLWHELAQLKFKEGDYAQATSMAARSNTWAGTDKTAARRELAPDRRGQAQSGRRNRRARRVRQGRRAYALSKEARHGRYGSQLARLRSR